MKKIAYFLSVLFLMTAFVPAAVGSTLKDKEKTELTAAEKERLSEIDARVAEIKAMDFSELSKEERKSVKKELKEMNKEAKQVAGGVYISAGAIILILLLLLIF
jgi:Flp pilus assembly protein TadB